MLVGISAPAQAAGAVTTCNSDTTPLAPGTYGKVVVPDGGACFTAGPVTIKGGLFVGQGATLVFGDEAVPVHTATITGGVHAFKAMSVQIHFSTINGGLVVQGGSGPFGGPFGVTWNTIEDSLVNGGAVIEGYNGFWQGFIRNHVNGGVTLNNNVLVDPDGNEFVTNTINGRMNCSGNSPAPQVGDSQGNVNPATGGKTGQCRAV